MAGRPGASTGWQHCRVTLATGERAFAKVAATGLDGVFEAEAAGLRWLAEAGAVPVPRVLGAGPGALVVSWVDGGPASRTRPSGSAGTWPGCTRRARTASARRGRVHRQPAAAATSRARVLAAVVRGRRLLPFLAGRWTPARSARTAPGWSRRSPAGIADAGRARRAARPDARRLLVGQRAVVRRPRRG